MEPFPDIILTDKLPDTVTERDFDDYRMARKLANDAILSEIAEGEVGYGEPQSREVVNNPKSIMIGRYEVDTWYSSPFPYEYMSLPKIYFCEFCLDYKKTQSTLNRHLRKCRWKYPLGDEIYRCGEISVFELDGRANVEYCKSLCLLSKLFLNCKIAWEDVDHFFFYVMTKNDKYGCHAVGYFSRDKDCPMEGDRENLSCVMVMPQYQKQGFGRFLIDFSYLLSRIEGVPGTPERPFSDFGKLSYHSYWKSTILEYLNKYRESKYLTVNDIMHETGICGTDIVETMRMLGFLFKISDSEENKEKWCLKVKRSLVDEHVATVAKSMRIKIDPECLKWVPFMPCISDKPLKYEKSSNAPNEILTKNVNKENINEGSSNKQFTRLNKGMESPSKVNIKPEIKLENNNFATMSFDQSDVKFMNQIRECKRKAMVLISPLPKKPKYEENTWIDQSTSAVDEALNRSCKNKKKCPESSTKDVRPVMKNLEDKVKIEKKDDNDDENFICHKPVLSDIQNQTSFSESEACNKEERGNIKQTKITSFFCKRG